jgi:predicted nuclease of predicted toxin-antitoxin system
LRFLVDNALSLQVARRLERAGHDAVHVRDRRMQAAPDEEVFELAWREGRILVSADTDFAAILARRERSNPSLILFRRASQRRPEAQVALLLANVSNLREELEAGCVAVLEETRVRVRRLPIRETEEEE